MNASHLTKRFGTFTALDDVSFSLRPGCTSLLGENGAGKTTLLNMIARVTTPTSGQIEGHDTIRVGYLPQRPALYPSLTPVETIKYAADLTGTTGVDALNLLKRVGLEPVDRPAAHLSGGMRQRLGIAQALVHDPELLLLDEPVSALDPRGRREVLDLLSDLKRERMILYSTHVLPDAEEASDWVLLLRQGRLLMEGTVTDLLGAKSSIQLRLFDDMTTEDDWSALAGVVRVSRTGTTWTFETSDKTMSERAILQRVLAQGLMIQSFHVGHPSLESLFLEVNA
ncbi:MULTISPECIES: ABC transporter ATP-binding protein [unclassified Exiguobacterium]|uniref:ABC transporter ATP-binding protein n=1 Tax=unclassified Exiguobacterium TaxID=2644629 RepID=UPI00103D08B9|nr:MULTISPECIES: ABC transporter ATP-binding protein [unclassified Exiguobacterium]TCI48141.1 ABC transporter ATP-binding protein [Exiguobacterium sp. SH5S32]TCI55026.1 ABC transporter ATP-binding protein [Exiguobacterium sp. SH1S4]TCI74820.1 ABC transporter ATP-binding protein [Exiguobacterium sp. SH1S1]